MYLITTSTTARVTDRMLSDVVSISVSTPINTSRADPLTLKDPQSAEERSHSTEAGRYASYLR
jgi:hypothetical protein